MPIIVRLWPFVFVLLVLLVWGGVRLLRHYRKRREVGPPAMEQIPTPQVVGVPAGALPDGLLGESFSDEGALAKVDWDLLVKVLKGEGHGRYAALLAMDGRFKAHDGMLFTLYRCEATINGTRQSVCVVVRVDRLGHDKARRLIVGLDNMLVLFADETRLNVDATPKGIAYDQATNADPAKMQHASSAAVLLLVQQLMTAARLDNLTPSS